jgi:hypothetical protein
VACHARTHEGNGLIMLGLGKSKKRGEPFRFRVSDAMEMPHRGYLLRLRRADGTPSATDLNVGARLRLSRPDGQARVVTIADHSVTQGKGGQARLDRTGEFDVVIDRADGWIEDMPVGIGWMASGPVDEEGARD